MSERPSGDGWDNVKCTGDASIEFHRRGARIKYQPLLEETPTRGDRAAIKDMSSRSRLDAAYDFENAECNWYCMTLLTWQAVPTADDVKRARAEFSKRWKKRWGEGMDAWILEMHRRGVPHLHLFHAAESNFGIECRASEKRNVVRYDAAGNEVVTEIVGGIPEMWMCQAWTDCIRKRSPETIAFNSGGIIEVFRNPAGAARYVAKDSSKRYQKELPERYKEGLGRWWYLNKKWKPKTTMTGTVDVDVLRRGLG